MFDFPSAMPDMGEELLGPGIVGIFYLLYMLVMIAFSVGVYVLQSLSLYAISKRRGIHNPWLSWIPVGNMWILGCISDQYQYVVKGKVKNKRKALLILSILMLVTVVAMMVIAVAMVLMGFGEPPQANAGDGDIVAIATVVIALIAVWGVMMVSSVAATVIQYMSLYDLYGSCEPNNSVLYLVLGILVNITLPIFLFICRNKDLGMPPRKPEPAPFIPQAPVEPVSEPWVKSEDEQEPWNTSETEE